MSYDVAIVGGGPAGLSAAIEAAKTGAKVILFEEHEEFGRPRHCTGLLSIRGVSLIGKVAKESIINYLRGVKVLSGDALLRVEFKKPQTVVLDRVNFEKMMAREAEKAGVHLLPRHTVTSLEVIEDSIVLRVRSKGVSKFYKSKRAIIATPLAYLLLRRYGYKKTNKYLPAYQHHLRVSNKFERDFALIILNKSISPGFFSWLVPLSHEEILVGLAGRRINPALNLLKLEEILGIKVREVIGSYSGLIYVGGPRKKLVYGPVIVVGDAAGHVKPTTGGGLFYGILCSRIAGRIASLGENLKVYEKFCHEMLAREMTFMKIIRKMLDIIPDQLIRAFIKSMRSSGVSRDIMKGDQDMQSRVLKALIKSPRFYEAILKVPLKIMK